MAAELFIDGTKLNIFIVFITISYVVVLRNVRLSSSHYFIVKLLNKQNLQQISFNHSSNMSLI